MSGGDGRAVILLTYHFPPFGSPGSHRSASFARHLPEHGFRPIVVTTGDVGFPRLDHDLATTLPGTLRVERVGEAVSRFHWRRRDPDASKTARVRAALASRAFSFPDHALPWSLVAGLRAGRIAAESGARLLLTSSPPHSTLLAGALARYVAGPGLRWLADLRDPIISGPDALDPGPSRRLRTHLLTRVLRRADAIACNTARLRAEVARTCPATTVLTLPNGYDPEAIATARGPRASRSPDGSRLLVHAGALYGGERDPTGLLEAIGRFQRARGDREPIRLSLPGVDADRLPERLRRALASVPAPARVDLPGFLPHRDALGLMASADVLVLFQGDAYPLQVPSKAYEYLALGRPVLALTSEGATADLVRAYPLGRVAHAGDVDTIARALAELADLSAEAPDVDTRTLAPSRPEVVARLAEALDALGPER